MDASLSGSRVVVITGGSSGIGRCTAALFARHGWRVGLIARGPEGLAASRLDVERAGGLAATAEADVTDNDALVEATNAIVAALGPIDVWINCAGNGVYGRFGDVPQAEFQRVTDVTYHGTVNGTRVALAQMRPRGQGRIVNVCSAIAFHGLPLMSSYAGAKAAVRAFGQAVQGELKLERSPIRITTVFPPAANTPYFSHAVSHMGWPARPAWPVYQPEVVAQGILQAAMGRRREMTISGTVVAFSLATRLIPGLVALGMGKMGIERQATGDPDARRLLEPTLFAPSRHVFDVHGPFGRGARRRSMHLWFERWLTTFRQLFIFAPFKSAPLKFAIGRRPPSVALPPTRVPPEPDPGLAGLAAPRVES